MTDEITLEVDGKPATKGSFRTFLSPRTGRIVTTNELKGTRIWQSMVEFHARRAMAGAPPWNGPVALGGIFYFSRPKAHFDRHGALKPDAPFRPIAKKYDLDKLLRCVMDGLTGTIYGDDCQVVQLLAFERLYRERDGMRLIARRLAERE